MKSARTKNIPKKNTETQSTFKMTTTNQVILAGILVLLIFMVALLSSPPKKSQEQQKPTSPQVTSVDSGTRSGTQIARITITRGNDSQQSVAGIGANGNLDIQTQPSSTATGIKPVVSGAKTQAATVAVVGAEKSGQVIPAGDRVKFKIDTFKKLAVQPLKFNVYDEKGAELTPDYLQTVREHKMHLYVVSANLREFQHLFPDYVNGQWNVNASLPNPGTYYAFTDISPVRGNPVVLRSDLIVREATKGTVQYPGLTPNSLAISDGVSVVLSLKGIGIGAENVIAYSLTHDGANANDVKPYAGAFGNIVLFRHTDLNLLVKARPLPVIDETRGMFDFAAEFSKAGRYTAFAEFRVGGKVVIFPITFDM